MKRCDRITFEHYSYLHSIFSKLIDLLPPFARNIAFKVILGSKGKNTLIDYGVRIRYFKKVFIGSNCELNSGCQIYPSYSVQDSKIKIGDRVVIGPNVVFFGAGQSTSISRDNIGDSIIVEDDVYIGGNTTIRYGITIGKGSTVAAHSCVVKNIPPNTIVKGVPAKN